MEKLIYLTILLCTYNRAKLLKPLLLELIKQVNIQENKDNIEILLINNNSTDETKEIILELQKNHSFIEYCFEPKQGLAISRNKGLSLAKGNVIVFIDDDIVLDKNWLKEINDSLQKYPYKAFGGKVIPLWEKEKPSYINLSGFFSLSQKIFPAHDNGDTEKLYPFSKEETNPIGANMWINKELFQKYGKFREDLGRVGYGGIPCEDTEFCSRLLRGSEKIFYYPKAIVFHPVSAYRMSKEFIKSWHYRNGISTIRKGGRNFPVLDLFRFLTRVFILIPYYLLFFLIGKILLNDKISSWGQFKLIRILGQIREFLRIWFKIPLKDPVF
ncbi:MAG: glycosyltransferase family 2 protein [Candidatus Melainabacteria bacterium]|nr:glycosyltransferase family 2 protein [Candidatus Melainabacteria bacterium]